MPGRRSLRASRAEEDGNIEGKRRRRAHQRRRNRPDRRLQHVALVERIVAHRDSIEEQVLAAGFVSNPVKPARARLRDVELDPLREHLQPSTPPAARPSSRRGASTAPPAR